MYIYSYGIVERIKEKQSSELKLSQGSKSL